MSFSENGKMPESNLATKDNIQFCQDFCNGSSLRKYILGRNIYTKDILNYIEVDGIIDDFTSESLYLGLPIIKMMQLPKDALVINASGGRPLSSNEKLKAAGLKHLHYFTLYKLAQLPLIPMRFNEGFEQEFSENKKQYDWIYNLLADDLSKSIFEKLVSFRFTYDLKYMEGFTPREELQYFEDFLNLQPFGETFLDVGSYDGFTSTEFIKHCPEYEAIHVFEPDPSNYPVCVKSLDGYKSIFFHKYGLSDTKATLNFDMQGSSSTISEQGGISISVDVLDELDCGNPSFIKIDIEGGELSALDGAEKTIRNNHPKLAVAAYHSAGDFWRIPQKVLSIRDDYDIYMRHYTESIYETVLFFIPKSL